MPVKQSYHRPSFYQYICGSGEVSSGYVEIFTAPYNVGQLAAVDFQVYTSGGVEKTNGGKSVYTPSALVVGSGIVSSGVVTITPASSIAYADVINVSVVYL